MDNASKAHFGSLRLRKYRDLMMDPLSKAAPAAPERQTVRMQAVPVALTALSIRLFAYGGQQGKLRDLMWQPESALTGLLRTIVHDGHGNATPIGDNVLLAHFKNPLHALSTARSLQQTLLTFDQQR